jgi:hypothetical protein
LGSKSAGFAALTGAAVGTFSDLPKLYRREMSAHESAALRGFDASEQAASQLPGVAAATGVVAGLK